MHPPDPASPRHIRALSVAFALTALSTAAAVHAQGRVIYVDAHAPNGGNGLSWNLAFRDLQDALAAANADHAAHLSDWVVIQISQGVYTPDRGTGLRSMSFSLASGVVLMGGFAGLLGTNPDERDPKRFVSVLSGDLAHNDSAFSNYGDNSRVIVDASAAIGPTLDGLTISGGNGDAPPSLPSHAGVAVQGGWIYLQRCTIERNISSAGAPIVSMIGGNMTECRIEDNIASDGDVFRIGQGASVWRSVIRGNRLLLSQASAVRRAIVEVSSTSNEVRFLSCLIADNTSDDLGIKCPDALATTTFGGCTIVRNTAPAGPALWVAGSQVAVRNCIIALNTSTSSLFPLHQVFISGGVQNLAIAPPILIDNGPVGVFPSAGIDPGLLIAGDPLFVSPEGPDHDSSTWQDNDYHLRPGSPAIDRANTTDPALVFGDLDENPYYDDPHTANLGTGSITYADLGCYEFQGALCPADFNASGSVSPQDLFDFLTAWFAHNQSADFDASGTVTVQDLFAFLMAWFRGC